MPIAVNEIQVGDYYLAGEDCDQLRKVTDITQDDKGRDRISYVAKSANIPNRKFEHEGTKSNPSLDETFAEACCSKLGANEVNDLRKNNIILSNE